MAEIADEPDEYLSDEKCGQLSRIQTFSYIVIRTCVYLVLSASRQSPDFY